MELEVSNALENEQQFWQELDEVVSSYCDSHELIDDSLRKYLSLTRAYKDEYLQTEYDVARCSYKLLDSTLFATHKSYVRRQILHCLLQEDDPAELHMIAAFLLFDGKSNETTFEDMNKEDAFPRILSLIQLFELENASLHRILLQLLYEMSRIQRIKVEELMLIEDDFILSLLRITETLSNDVSDPYHYPVIRVLLVLNEQYMVCAHDPVPAQAVGSDTLPNKVITTLSTYGHAFKTFGENIILLLNRESETSLQLLILKLLYLLFTTPATYEYFYTNDLRVLVDVIIRNLLDLPHAAAALRHTYLRVLHPLLAHTQLADPDNHYKREELLKVLYMLTGASPGGGPSVQTVAHFGATDETTKRLGTRCVAVPWLQGDGSDDTSPEQSQSTAIAITAVDLDREGSTTSNDSAQPPSNIIVPKPWLTSNDTGKKPSSRRARSANRPTPSPPPPRRSSASATRHLAIGANTQAAESSLSVAAVASPRAKPGVQTPSRGREAAAATGKEDGHAVVNGEESKRKAGAKTRKQNGKPTEAPALPAPRRKSSRVFAPRRRKSIPKSAVGGEGSIKLNESETGDKTSEDQTENGKQ